MADHPQLDPLNPDDPLRGVGDRDLANLTTNDLLRRLIVEQRRTNLQQVRLYPEVLDWSVFPGNGQLQPMLPGKTTFDLEAAQVNFPDGTSQALPSNLLSYGPVQSMILVTDAPVTWTIDPSGQGSFSTDVNYIIHGKARNARYVYATAPWPYLAVVVFSPSIEPPLITPVTLGLQRYSDVSLGNPNAYTNISFVAEAVGVTPQASAKGSSTLPCVALGNKNFFVRNLGPATIQVQVHGQGYGLFGDTLDAAGAPGWILDPDIHAAGGPNASFVTIGPGSVGVLETGIQWSFVRLRALPTTSSGARIITEFSAHSVGIR